VISQRPPSPTATHTTHLTPRCLGQGAGRQAQPQSRNPREFCLLLMLGKIARVLGWRRGFEGASLPNSLRNMGGRNPAAYSGKTRTAGVVEGVATHYLIQICLNYDEIRYIFK
jgi:hypothetical protein